MGRAPITSETPPPTTPIKPIATSIRSTTIVLMTPITPVVGVTNHAPTATIPQAQRALRTPAPRRFRRSRLRLLLLAMRVSGARRCFSGPVEGPTAEAEPSSTHSQYRGPAQACSISARRFVCLHRRTSTGPPRGTPAGRPGPPARRPGACSRPAGGRAEAVMHPSCHRARELVPLRAGLDRRRTRVGGANPRPRRCSSAPRAPRPASQLCSGVRTAH